MRLAILSRHFVGIALALLVAGQSLAQGSGQPIRVVLKGYDPVAYFTDRKPTKGAPGITHDFDEGRYQFSSAQHREMFAVNPDRYAPQFDGLCATGLAMGMKADADPNVWKIVNGKLYVFSSPKALEMAEKDPTLLDKSHKAWPAAK